MRVTTRAGAHAVCRGPHHSH